MSVIPLRFYLCREPRRLDSLNSQWVSNYTQNHGVITPWCYITIDFQSITEAIPSTSPADIDIYPYVVEATQSLFCWSVDMGTISSTTDHQADSAPGILASFMSLAGSFTERNPRYIPGIPAAQATVKLLSIDSSNAVSQNLVDSAINLVMLITYSNITESQPVQKTWDDHWGKNILKMVFPATDLTELDTESDVLLEPSSSDIQRRSAAISDIVPKLYIIIFFETSHGCLGAADSEPVAGDCLCPLAGHKKGSGFKTNLEWILRICRVGICGRLRHRSCSSQSAVSVNGLSYSTARE
jgi:hypothetical protein